MSAVTRTYPDGALRVSDADRDAAVAELSEHYEAGRLTSEELEDRSGRALRARTGADLAGLVADLPEPRGSQRPGTGRRRRRLALAVLLAAVAVATSASVAVSAGTAGHMRVDLFPCWLIVACFLLWRRHARS